MMEAYNEKTELTMQMLAWHAANTMNVHLKRKVTVKKLLGKEKNMSPLERELEVEKLKKALAERGDRHAE